MTMKKIFAILLALVAVAAAERPVYNPFASYGLEIGAGKPVNDIWKDNRTAFGEASFIANFQLLPYTSVTADAGYSFPGNGFSAKLGLQQMLLPTGITPFIGGMAGIRAIPEDDAADTFGDRFGPTVEANAGLFLFRESWVSFRLKGSYQWTFAKEIHHGFGVSIGILFANSRPGLKAIDVSK